MVKYKTSSEALRKSKRNLGSLVREYMTFLDNARTPTMAVKAAQAMLESNGFVKYDESRHLPYRVYFIDRNSVNIAAVVTDGNEDKGLNIAGAHVDFCTLTNKVVSAVEKSDGVYLDTRPYGGFYPHQWMDRPLTIIGETLAQNGDKRELVQWRIPGNIPEATIHNPDNLREKNPVYKEAFKLENLDVFTGYKSLRSFLSAVNRRSSNKSVKITIDDFNSGFTHFYVTPSEKTMKLGNYIVGYGYDDRSCLFAALKALTMIKDPKYTCIALGVAREEIGSCSVGSANDVFLDNVVKVLARNSKSSLHLSETYSKSVMLSADVDIAYTPQNQAVTDKENNSHFGNGAALVIANGSNGVSTGNIVMPNDLYFMERFLNRRDMAYQVTALPSKVGIGGGGGTIARFYTEKGILTADLGIPVGNMHGTTSRIFAADLDSTVEAFIGLYLREEERKLWG